MIPLDDPIWQTLEGGYRVPYNPMPALERLEMAETREEEKEVFRELWDKLHHQGDVGTASYATVPHLVKIGKKKGIKSYDLPALVALVEIQRHESQNPSLPEEFKESYANALVSIPELIASSLPGDCDEYITSSVCAALAASKGQFNLARAYLEMREDVALEFLKEQTGYEPSTMNKTEQVASRNPDKPVS
ncbi:hypothetical protein [Rubellicoccus peritrichatus]|uniref:Uncharacterized protein n=1 Tax=Rubellicoccus peritrichatus TaxID=3080537 RepID=A0AAQ3L9D4_9BACT|nr:hypothetical protein [Puniceicoccus sp. CR14]WOO40344.1 hypothetical protein RZN69_17130 [Puniceicoccus sp. CR14]